MFRPSFLNILIFWFAKYLALYIVLMFKNNNYALVKVNEIKSGGDLFYYLWIFLFLPVVVSILFSAPMHYLLKLKNAIHFSLLVSFILLAEYFLYTWLASQSNLANGLINGAISVLFIMLFFFRHVSSIYKQKEI